MPAENPFPPPNSPVSVASTNEARTRWREWRENQTAAWVAPFFVFLAFLALSSLVKVDEAGAPWWRGTPEHWAYPLQTLVCLGLVAWWWPCYRFRPLTASGLTLGVLAGVIGIAFWILPSWLWWKGGADQWPGLFPGWEWKWLGFVSRSEEGFDPTIWSATPAVYWGVVLLRFVRMTIAVPFVEELFWRGFLWRSVSHPWLDFWKAPIGEWSWRALGVTVPLFVVAHQPADYAGAVLWGLMVSFVLVRTRSLGACVLCHAVSNAILGIYVMQTRQWGFW